MDDLYSGREQSWAKHEILRRYLTPFAHKILSTWPSIDFVDGFSGPWENRDQHDLSDTSIGIALSTLSKVAESQGHSAERPRIRCIFNEKDPASFALLDEFLTRKRKDYPLIEAVAFKGAFETNASTIRTRANNRFTLLFVDPTGYTGFPPSSLVKFKGRSTEIIVNFMRSFMERFVSGEHADRRKALVGLVGTERADKLLADPFKIEDVEDEYLAMLKEDLGFCYAGYSPIHNPDRDQIHFNLAYATNHPKGMDTMRSAEFSALSEHDQNRFKKKQPPDQPDLFSSAGNDLPVRGPYLSLRMKHQSEVGDRLLSLLAKTGGPVQFDELVGRLQEHLFLKKTEIKAVVVDLANRGRLRSPWKDRSARGPSDDDPIELA